MRKNSASTASKVISILGLLLIGLLITPEERLPTALRGNPLLEKFYAFRDKGVSSLAAAYSTDTLAKKQNNPNTNMLGPARGQGYQPEDRTKLNDLIKQSGH